MIAPCRCADFVKCRRRSRPPVLIPVLLGELVLVLARHPREVGIAHDGSDAPHVLQGLIVVWELCSVLAEVVPESLGFAVADHFFTSELHHIDSSTPPVVLGVALNP